MNPKQIREKLLEVIGATQKGKAVLSNRFEVLAQRAAAAMEHSENLVKPHLNLATIDDILGKDSAPLLSVFLCIPFLFPLPLPGLSTAFGFAIIFLALRSFYSAPPKLPQFLGRREVSAQMVAKICENGRKALLPLERYVHPRLPFMTSRWGNIFSALAIIGASLALAIPVPPVVPLTNFFPAVAIVLLSVAELEDDGLVAIAGHIMHLVAWGYFALLGGVVFVSFEKLIDYLRPLFL